MRPFLNEQEQEKKRHAEAIDKIAASVRVSPDVVKPLYERVLAELQEQAKIKTFLAIFAARRVEQLLKGAEPLYEPMETKEARRNTA